MAAIACGWTGWSGEILLLPVAMLFPALWAHAPSRLAAAAVSAGYFLAASRGLPQGVANFFDADLWPGLLLWLAASASFVSVHAVLWPMRRNDGRPGRGSAVRYLAAAVLMALPPFGITGWAQPVTAAGILFPGSGWWGLAAAAAGLGVMTSRYWPAAAIALTCFWLWSAATWTPPAPLHGWRGIDLHHGASLGRNGSLDRHRDLIAMVRQQAGNGGRVIVLPESALGFWTPTVARFWQGGLRDVTAIVIAGAAVVDGSGYDNVIVAISAGEARILYRERMPVPVSMWQPWRAWTGSVGGARAHMFANPVVEVAGARIAPLICYEQLILWPVLQSILHKTDIVVAVGNGWWAAGNPIIDVQRASAVAWAKLFGLAFVLSINT